MKTNFINQQFRMPDGGGMAGGGIGGGLGQAAGAAAGMAFPPLAIAQGIGGLAQGILGYTQAHKAQKQLEKLVNSYQPNQSIMDYYNKALQRYNVNPYQSRLYQMQTQNAARGLTTGINTLQDRRSALAGVSGLVQGYNDASLKAAAAAEGQQAQALGQLGQATGMKAAEDKYPFQLKYGLLAAKAGGGNQIMNAGLSNIFGGLQTGNQYNQLKQIYGG